MKYEFLKNPKKAEKVVSLLNMIAIALAIIAFLAGKTYFIYIMTLALAVLLASLVVIMHFARGGCENKKYSILYHLIAVHLILTVCSFFTSAKVADFNKFSYVFVTSLLAGLLVLIAVQLVLERKAIAISAFGFITVFILSLFQVNIVLNIVLALVMAAVIFTSLAKLMKPTGIYGIVFGVIALVVAVTLLIKPMAAVGFYGHITVCFALVSFYFVLPLFAKDKAEEPAEETAEEVEEIKKSGETTEKARLIKDSEEAEKETEESKESEADVKEVEEIKESEAAVEELEKIKEPESSEKATEDIKESEKAVKKVEKIKKSDETAEKAATVKESKKAKAVKKKDGTAVEDKDLPNRNRWIIKKYKSLPLDELMKAPVDALWGVSENDAKLLKAAFNIKTVEDLATNKFFNWAVEIAEKAKEEK
ncbi:MAG TPA: hypothetical protein PLI19_02080 [Erysipelotrichaceae bacterium]|nr:hypothetical protein [Erysipelotrichaceae bacterium]